MGFDPAIDVALDICLRTMSRVHHGIFGVDIGNRQLHDAKQFRRRRVFLGPGFVGDNMHCVHREAIVHAVWQFGINIFLFARQGRERHLQPDDVFTRLQHIADPVRRPGVVDDRLALFITGNGVGHHGGIVTLIVGDGIIQAIGIKLMVDDRFTAPARRTAGQIGFAVAVGVKKFGDFRIF